MEQISKMPPPKSDEQRKKYIKIRDELISKVKPITVTASKTAKRYSLELSIINGRMTLKKNGKETKNVSIEEYFNDRHIFSLPERRLVVKAIEHIDPDLGTEYSVYLTLEQMAEIETITENK